MTGRLYMLHGSPRQIALEDLSRVELRDALDHWRVLAGDRVAPSWSDVDLLWFPAEVVPGIMVVDVIADPPDFRYRFFGTWHARCHKHDMTGHCVSDYDDKQYRAEIMREYQTVVNGRAPVATVLAMTLNHIVYTVEILRLPLSDDGEVIDRILVIECPL